MKNILSALVVVGVVSSCGLGNSAGSSAGSATSSTSARSSGNSSAGGLFSRRNRVEKRAAGTTQTSDGRSLVSVIKAVKFDRTRDGGIVRARGLMPRQGYYDAKLVSTTGFKPDENGVLTLEFRAIEPQFQTYTSTERSREIDVGVFLSHQKLAAAKSIRVVGRQNQISLRGAR